MNCLIVCRETETSWYREYFRGCPYLLKICNKPLLEYFIDFCALLKADEIRIVMDESDGQIEKYFDDGSRWGRSISYSLIKKSDSLDTIIKKNRSFCSNQKLLVFDGYFFIFYNKEVGLSQLLPANQSESSFAEGRCGIFLSPKGGENVERVINPIVPGNGHIRFCELKSIKDYYEIGQDILTNMTDDYVLPGYSNQPGVHIGQNVEICKNVTINEPVMLGNNVTLKPGSIIGPGTIIGDQVLVDAGTSVVSSVILDSTYLGTELTIHDKVVSANLLISPVDGESVSFEDAFLLSQLETNLVGKIFRQLVHGLGAFILALLQLFPYALCRLILHYNKAISKTSKEFLLAQKSGRLYTTFQKKRSSFAAKIFYALSLDKLPLLPAVLKGDILLLGNRLLPDTMDNQEFLKDFPQYTPGVFNYSELEDDLDENTSELNISERYFTNKSSLLQDFKLFFRILFCRFSRQIIESQGGVDK